MRCHAPIFECMGFVLARDFNAAWDGKIPWEMVREHCGKCANIIDRDETYWQGIKYLDG